MSASNNRSVPPHPKSDSWGGAPLLLSLATGPVLLGLIGIKVLAETLQQVGAMGEEIFRGDRLPLLNFPVATDADPDNRETSG